MKQLAMKQMAAAGPRKDLFILLDLVARRVHASAAPAVLLVGNVALEGVPAGRGDLQTVGPHGTIPGCPISLRNLEAVDEVRLRHGVTNVLSDSVVAFGRQAALRDPYDRGTRLATSAWPPYCRVWAAVAPQAVAIH